MYINASACLLLQYETANIINLPLGCAVGLDTRVSKLSTQSTAALNFPIQSGVTSECTRPALSHH